MVRRSSLLVLVLLAGSAVAHAAGPVEFNLTAGLDFDGSFEADVEVDSDAGFSLGLEMMFDGPMFEVGAGLEYGFERGADAGLDELDVDYRNLYLAGRLRVFFPALYVVGRYGYGEVSGVDDIDGGGTWSAGAGLSFADRFKVEVMLNNFEMEIAGVDVDYETWSARLVYTF